MRQTLSIELLRSFVAVVELGSMQKATNRVFLSQSAISLQMKRLEAVVQTPLFQRKGNRKLAITPAGMDLLGHAKKILALHDRAMEALRDPTSKTDPS